MISKGRRKSGRRCCSVWCKCLSVCAFLEDPPMRLPCPVGGGGHVGTILQTIVPQILKRMLEVEGEPLQEQHSQDTKNKILDTCTKSKFSHLFARALRLWQRRVQGHRDQSLERPCRWGDVDRRSRRSPVHRRGWFRNRASVEALHVRK